MTDNLTKIFTEKEVVFNQWLENKAAGLIIPFYSSADIRDSGYKAACIDLNIFPAGFNNLCEKFAEKAALSVKSYLLNFFGEKSYHNVVLVPEAHSRNKFYNAHLLSLKNILESAGLNVTVAAMSSENFRLETFDGKILITELIKIKNNLLVNQNDIPFDWVLLNNDLSDGKIDFLEGIAQPVIPSISFGWHERRKSCFFNNYNALITDFAKEFSFDPWILSAETHLVSDIDFQTEIGREKVAAIVENVLISTEKKYKEYNISEQPRVFIKNDSGTYGIGIMVVGSADEIINMNRKSKNKMAVGKGKQPIKSVIVQEAVPTRNITENFVSEPVIYMIGNEVIGTFLRANSERGAADNLNAKGMTFYRYCSLLPVEQPSECTCTSESQNFYNFIAKLSAVAAAKEIENDYR